MEQPAEYIDANENGQKKFLTAPQVYSIPDRRSPMKPQRERSDDFKISERHMSEKSKSIKSIGFLCKN